MSLSAELFWKPSNESVADGYIDQPVVAIYIPERDGIPEVLKEMDVQGADIHYREWNSVAALEGMQQMIEHEKERAVADIIQAVDDEIIREKTHDDYSLFVISPDVQPSWYETLGEVKDLTGVLLTGELSEYGVDAVQKLEERVGMEAIFTDVGKAAMHIERKLHKAGLLK